jgi:hypothetical protein
MLFSFAFLHCFLARLCCERALSSSNAKATPNLLKTLEFVVQKVAIPSQIRELREK